MKTRTKLIAGFAAVIILVLAAFHMTANIYAEMERQFNTLEGEIIPSVMRMHQIETEAGDIFSSAMEYSVTGSTGAREAALSGTEHLAELGITHFNQEAQIGSEEEEAARELIREIDAFGAAVNTMVNLKDQQADDAVFPNLEKESLSPALGDLREMASRHKDYLLTKMAKTEEAIRMEETAGMQLLFSSAALMTLAAIILAFFIARSIVRPLNALRQGVEIIGQGNLDYTVGTRAGDEIGQLSRAFDQMTRDLKKKTTSIDNLNREIAERQRAEDALRDNEEKYHAIFEQASDSIVIINLEDNRIVDFNDNAHNSLGYTREEFARLRLCDIDCLESDEDTRRRSEEIQEKKMITFESKHRTKNGEIRDVLINAKSFQLKGGRYNLAVWRDITERKRAEEALRESEEKYRAIFEQALDAIVIISAKDSRIVDFNDNAYKNLGYSREEFAGLRLSDIDFLESEDETRERSREISEKGIVTFETKHWAKNGEIRDVLVSAKSFQFNGESYNMAIWHDITESKRAEEALRESEEFSSSLMKSSAIPILVVNDDTSIRYINAAFEKLTGFTSKEVIGSTTPYPWWVKNVASGRVDESKNDIHTGVRGLEKLFWKKNGERFWVAINSAPVKRDGIFQYSLENWLDITERKRAEEALRQSEEKYRAIFEQASDSIVIIDSETDMLVDFNTKAHENLGYSREEFAKLKMKDIDATESHEDARERLPSLDGDKTDFFESKHRKKGGDIRDVLVSSRFLNIGAKNLVVSIWHDITERKLAEEALRESEEKYHAIFEQASDSIVLINMATRQIMDFNDRAYQNLGYTREEFAKLRLDDIDIIKSSDDIGKHDDKIEKEGSDNFETKHRTKNGEIRNVLVSARTLNIGDRKFSLSIWHDITERKRAEEEYRTIIETTPDGFSIADLNGRWLDVNDSHCRITGYTQEEMLKMSIADIEVGENPREVAEHIKRIKEQGHDRFEGKYRRKDGRIIDVEISVNYLDVGGGRLFTFTHDITQRKKGEAEIKKALANLEQSSTQLAAMNKELEAFSYSVSHDLRAPLRTIDGFSEALLEDYRDKLDEEGRDYLRRVRSASQRMGELIDNLLKLSRLSRSEMHKEKVDLSALAEEVAAGLEQTEPERQVEFVISPRLTVSGDRQLLKVVLENLLGNAWKFTGKQPKARIEVGRTENGDKNGKAYFVRDNGTGFDMTYADKLFGAFQRLHDTSEFPGTGIGLATVQRIISRHGGRTWAEGAVGKGATFYFTLN